MQTLIEARALGFKRAGRLVFSPTTLAVSAGQCVVVSGANGSGKTTFLRLLAGILKPSTGSIHRPWNDHTGVSFIGHQTACKGDLSCLENLQFQRAFFADKSLMPTMSPIEALAEIGLIGLMRRNARSLSAGQKKRLGLAGLLVTQAPLWLLDEPYASLDEAGAQHVDRLIDRHLGRGGAVVLSTHRRQPELTHPIGRCPMTAAEDAA